MNRAGWEELRSHIRLPSSGNIVQYFRRERTGGWDRAAIADMAKIASKKKYGPFWERCGAVSKDAMSTRYSVTWCAATQSARLSL
jgi:hypothetical protein